MPAHEDTCMHPQYFRMLSRTGGAAMGTRAKTGCGTCIHASNDIWVTHQVDSCQNGGAGCREDSVHEAFGPYW